MRSVRDDRFKLVRWPRIHKTQLFDLQNDPHERNDLASASGHQARIEQMTRQLIALQREFDDTQPLTDENTIPEQIDLQAVKRKPDKWQPQWIVDKYFEKDPQD